jgi:tellurium resistance protein TerD
MKRGANVALTREIPDLASIVVGVRFAAGAEQVLIDSLVLATILCDEDSKALSDEHFVFFNQLQSPDLSVAQLEQVIGSDTEQVEIDLTAVPDAVDRIVLIAYVNEAIAARRSLGQLKDCTVRVLNLADNAELVKSENLAPALSAETALVLGEVYRHDGHWKFKVIGLGYADGIKAVARDFGVHL